jgi:arylsulfatase A-like enzyme
LKQLVTLFVFLALLCGHSFGTQPNVLIIPFLTGENTAAPHDALYWRMGEQMAVRVGDWKLVKASEDAGDGEKPSKKPKGNAKLFNLATSEPERVKHLTALWEKWSAEMPKPAVGTDPDTKRKKQKP